MGLIRGHHTLVLVKFYILLCLLIHCVRKTWQHRRGHLSILCYARWWPTGAAREIRAYISYKVTVGVVQSSLTLNSRPFLNMAACVGVNRLDPRQGSIKPNSSHIHVSVLTLLVQKKTHLVIKCCVSRTVLNCVQVSANGGGT